MKKNSLNPEQQKAVETTEGPVLIVAGAGAGKTKTLTHRMLNLLQKGVSPEAILAITFTNKAASEMRERVENMLPANSRRPFIGTFHSLGVLLLREQPETRRFTIFDRADSKQAVKEALKKRGYDPKQFDPGKILSMISRLKGDGVTYTTYRDSHERDYIGEVVLETWEAYETALRQEKAFDFDDLLLEAAELLANQPEVRKRYQDRWKYIHVDEYQDTNLIQYKLVKLLAEGHNNICVVGDADQTIYSWRGATVRNILNFERDYQNAKVILLEENYRSTKNILTAANQIIAKNSDRIEKNLFTQNEDGEPIFLYTAWDENDEAGFIATRAKELLEKGTRAGEIAVLYRANFQSRVLEEAMLQHDLPYQVLGTRFFERKEVKDIISFVRLARNKKSIVDLRRVINLPPRGIGKVTLMKIVEGNESTLPAATKKKVDEFWKLVERIQDAGETKTPSELVKFVVKEIGLDTYFKEDPERLENVQELATLAKKYDALPLGEGVDKLIEEAALASEQDSLSHKEKNDSIKLMTVHAAKGLEFDYVFVAGLEQDLFPHARMDDSSDPEEERRLFYVALTRARKRVFLTHANTRTIFGAPTVHAPSEFIGDIDEGLIEQQTIENRGFFDDITDKITW